MGSPTQPLRVRFGVASHRGKVREENQDRHGIFEMRLGRVFAIADGMGGHLDGARAAELVIEELERELGEMSARHEPEDALRRAATAANAEVYRQSAASAAAGSRMGSTLVMVLVREGRAVIGHAGDSRAYLLREGLLRPLTKDHTVVQRMVEKGILKPWEARHHPDSGIVRRALGKREELELEVSRELKLLAGDRLLLCSDGLCGFVDDEDIALGLSLGSVPQTAADVLLESALEAGGEDNVTVLVLDIEESDVGEIALGSLSRERLNLWTGRGRGAWLGLTIAVGIAALWVGLMMWMAS